MVKAKVKQKGTSYEDIFYAVPESAADSQSAREIWKRRFKPNMLSYDTFNRIIGRLHFAEYEGKPIINRRKAGVSFLYWRDLKEFPKSVRFIE
jgi:hypothetical protein